METVIYVNDYRLSSRTVPFRSRALIGYKHIFNIMRILEQQSIMTLVQDFPSTYPSTRDSQFLDIVLAENLYTYILSASAVNNRALVMNGNMSVANATPRRHISFSVIHPLIHHCHFLALVVIYKSLPLPTLRLLVTALTPQHTHTKRACFSRANEGGHLLFGNLDFLY
jgi:hypothetical protein